MVNVLGCTSNSIIAIVCVVVFVIFVSILVFTTRKVAKKHYFTNHYPTRFKSVKITEISPPLPLGRHPYSNKPLPCKQTSV